MSGIFYRVHADGGFLAGNPDAGLVAYAYPSSAHASKARHAPELIARRMVVAAEQSAKFPVHPNAVAEIAARDARWIAELREHGTELSA